MSTIALIPARGGSKGVPRKNIRLLGNKPLIAHSIETARQARRIDRVIVSTDDAEIAEVAQRWGADVPFLRPSALAQDDTPDWPVFNHAITWLRDHQQPTPDLWVHLRPTSPFRSPSDIDRGIALLESHPDADSVRSVCLPGQNPHKMWRVIDGVLQPLLTVPGMKEPFNAPRQRLPTIYWQTGQIDITRQRTLLEKQSMTGDTILALVVDLDMPIDIDTPAGFALAEWWLQRQTSGRP